MPGRPPPWCPPAPGDGDHALPRRTWLFWCQPWTDVRLWGRLRNHAGPRRWCRSLVPCDQLCAHRRRMSGSLGRGPRQRGAARGARDSRRRARARSRTRRDPRAHSASRRPHAPRSEGLPLSLFHPYKRLPPEGAVSGGRRRMVAARTQDSKHCNYQASSISLVPRWAPSPKPAPHGSCPPAAVAQTLMRDEETCNPEERTCKVRPGLLPACAPHVAAAPGRGARKRAASLLPPLLHPPRALADGMQPRPLQPTPHPTAPTQDARAHVRGALQHVQRDGLGAPRAARRPRAREPAPVCGLPRNR